MSTMVSDIFDYVVFKTVHFQYFHNKTAVIYYMYQKLGIHTSLEACDCVLF